MGASGRTSTHSLDRYYRATPKRYGDSFRLDTSFSEQIMNQKKCQIEFRLGKTVHVDAVGWMVVRQTEFVLVFAPKSSTSRHGRVLPPANECILLHALTHATCGA